MDQKKKKKVEEILRVTALEEEEEDLPSIKNDLRPHEVVLAYSRRHTSSKFSRDLAWLLNL